MNVESIQEGNSLAIMQPYFLPYLGYFQLIAAVDKFVILDDVNYMKGGWINRNRILNQGQPKWVTMALSKASPHKLICETKISKQADWRKKMRSSVTAAYRKAPFFEQGLSLFEETIGFESDNLSTFLSNSITKLTALLVPNVEIVPTSSKYPKNGLEGAERVLNICELEGAKTYVNVLAGKDLYDPNQFSERGIALTFIVPDLPAYPQAKHDFVSGLSILDVLMWNSIDDVRKMANNVVLSC